MKRFMMIFALLLACLLAVGCNEALEAVEAAESIIAELPASATAEPEEGADAPENEPLVVAPDTEFIPVGADAANFADFKKMLADDAIDEIKLDKDVEITENVTVEKTVIISEGVTLSVAPGAVLYVDNGLIDNAGSIVIMGADSAEAPNTGVFAIVNGGGVVNKGSMAMMASAAETASDNPLGGQLRLQGGTIENSGTVYFYAGPVNTSGGVGDVGADGAFLNSGLVQVDGNFLRITGQFVNDGQLVSNAIIYVEGASGFENNGSLTGTGTVNDTPAAQYEG